MQTALKTCGWLVLLTASAFAQAQTEVVDLPTLRQEIQHRLLTERETYLAVTLDHLWKSNGGALLVRSPSDPNSQALASRLASQLTWDEPTGSLVWPVAGFTDITMQRFTPTALWTVVAVAMPEPRYTPETVADLRGRFVTARDARPVFVDPLIPPVGLSMPAEKLLCANGFCGSRVFVYSAANCFDVAMKCYYNGFHSDALVFLSHAIAQQQDSRLYYFRGTIEMLTGRPDDAKMSAVGVIALPVVSTMGPYRQFYERVNGPPAIQFRELVSELSNPLIRRTLLPTRVIDSEG
ncbi:MAG TPA: hypothetical protein VFG20_21475 [Planctomycetaceae bacterium]|nr:hypothetical protein [Planctomycetaceae bacterium]